MLIIRTKLTSSRSLCGDKKILFGLLGDGYTTGALEISEKKVKKTLV